MSYVGWVCCWISPLLREVFSPGTSAFPLLKNEHFQIPIRSGTILSTSRVNSNYNLPKTNYKFTKPKPGLKDYKSPFPEVMRKTKFVVNTNRTRDMTLRCFLLKFARTWRLNWCRLLKMPTVSRPFSFSFSVSYVGTKLSNTLLCCEN